VKEVDLEKRNITTPSILYHIAVLKVNAMINWPCNAAQCLAATDV
jgi:hypothetical protein